MVDAGAFGSVVKCIDKKEGKVVAVKISKNKDKDRESAFKEAKLLKEINDYQQINAE